MECGNGEQGQGTEICGQRWWQRSQRGCRRAKEWPPTGEEMDYGKGLDRCATQDTRVQVRRRKGRSKKIGSEWP